MKQNTIYCLLIAALGLSALAANTANALDLEQAFQAALANDPTYQAAIAQKGVTDAQKKQARAALLPTISLSGSYLHTNTRYTDTFLSNAGRVVKTYPANLMISMSQPLLQWDKITGYKQIDLNVSGGVLQLAQARQDLINRTIQAYFTALLAEKNATIAAEQERNTGIQLKIVKRSFEVGNTTVIDTHEAEAAYYRAKAAAINAQSTAINARSALGDMMGQTLDEREPIDTLNAPLRLKMPIPDTQDKWVARAREEAYAVQLAKIAYQVAELEVKRKAQQRLPTINLTANQTWKSTSLKRVNDSSTSVQNFGVEMSMPIFDGGLIGAQVLEAEALKTKSYQTMRSTETQVAQATRTAYNQAVSGLATIAALESAKQSAAASVKSNEIGRSLGMRINIDVLNAEQTHAQTQYDLAQAQYNTVMGNVNLKAAISRLSDEDIRFINGLLDHKRAALGAVKTTVDDNLNRTLDPMPIESVSKGFSKALISPDKPLTTPVPPTIKAPKALQKDQSKVLKVTEGSNLMKAPSVESTAVPAPAEAFGAEFAQQVAGDVNGGYVNGLLSNGALKRAKQVAWSDVTPH